MPDATQERAAGLDFVGFDLCLDAHRGRLYGIAYSILRNHADAEDAVQGALLKAWRAWPRVEERDAAGAWLGRPYSSPSSASNSSTWRISIRTSRDLLPSKGPTTRCSASWSTRRAARV